MVSEVLTNDQSMTILLGAAILIVPALITFLFSTRDFSQNDYTDGQEVAKQNQENAVTVSDQSTITDTKIVQGGPQQQVTFADLRRKVEQMPDGYNGDHHNFWTRLFSWLHRLLPETVWSKLFAVINWGSFVALLGTLSALVTNMPIFGELVPVPVQNVGAASGVVLAQISVGTGVVQTDMQAMLWFAGFMLLLGIGMYVSIEYFTKQDEAQCPECETLFSLASQKLGIESKDHVKTHTMDDGDQLPVYLFEGRRILECQNPDCEATVIRTEKWKDTL